MVGSQLNMTVKTDRTLAMERNAVLNAVRQATVKPSDAVFRFNKAIEDAFQRGAAGKQSVQALRDFNGSWVQSIRSQGKAIEELLDTFERNPAKAYAYLDDAARFTNETLGKYNQFSPRMRLFIQGWAPFMAWYINSVRLFAYTLPVRSPLLTAMLAASTRAVDEDLKAQAEKAPSEALRSGIPLGEGRVLDVARITPLGIAAEPASVLGKEFVPQLMNARDILIGQNPVNPKMPLTDENGREIDGQVVRYFLAANAFMEGITPYVSLARRLMTPGRTQAINSTWPSGVVRYLQGGRSKDEAFRVRPNVQRKNPFAQFLSPIPIVKYGGKKSGADSYLTKGSTSSGGASYLTKDSSTSSGASYLLRD